MEKFHTIEPKYPFQKNHGWQEGKRGTGLGGNQRFLVCCFPEK